MPAEAGIFNAKAKTSVLPCYRHPGEGRGPVLDIKMDTGLRRYDEYIFVVWTIA
jgi:hypothetical protein